MLFKHIIGQSTIKEKLIANVKNNRVSHALLFLGPEGSGNLALAIAFAQYIQCLEKTTEDSCGTCSACIKIQKLVHPDLHFFYPVNGTKEIETKNANSKAFVASWRMAVIENKYLNINDWLETLGIENKQAIISEKESDEILQKVSVFAYEGEYKIIFIWMPEMMHTSISNKILKLLEEPPEKTLFLLVANNSEAILPTILSRCQLVKIPQILSSEIKKSLIDEFQISNEDAEKIIQIADGNYNLALKNLDYDEAQNFYLENFQLWMRHCYKSGDFAGLMNWVDELSATGREKLKSFIRYSLFIVRECMNINYGSENLMRLNEQELAWVQKFHKYIQGINAIEITKELNECYYHIERNGSVKIILLDATLKLNRQIKRARSLVE